MMPTKHKLTSILVGISFLLPQTVIAQNTFVFPTEVFTQDFVLTAYYSPLPDQCCYVKGSLEADIVLNGRGTNGADGTAVYPGMIAAPPSYPFGTRVVLPGLGTFTVHDRGGAIQEQGKVHRIDVWAGAGEEGLARALAFGVQRIRGTVYPPKTEQPAESIDLATLPAPLDRLKPFAVAAQSLPDARPKLGDRSLTARMFQESLKKIGYFADQPTGFFGPVTFASLQKLRSDFGIEGGEEVTDTDAAFIEAMHTDKPRRDPVAQAVDAGSIGRDVAQAKRTLRYLGYFKGRTNGTFDEALQDAILRFQQDQKLVADASSPGAGRIGPKTRAAIIALWKKDIVAKSAEQILARHRVEQLVASNATIDSYLEKGDTGPDVRALQSFLKTKGLLRADQITGLFGDGTMQALIQYQIAAGIIDSVSQTGAGRVGPGTLKHLRETRVTELYRVVRAEGWDAI